MAPMSRTPTGAPDGKKELRENFLLEQATTPAVFRDPQTGEERINIKATQGVIHALQALIRETFVAGESKPEAERAIELVTKHVKDIVEKLSDPREADTRIPFKLIPSSPALAKSIAESLIIHVKGLLRELEIDENNLLATVFTPHHTSDPKEQARLSEMLEAYIVAYTAHYLEMQSALFFDRQTSARKINTQRETGAIPWTKTAQDMLERLARYVSNDELRTFLDPDKLLSALNDPQRQSEVPFVFTRDDLDKYLTLTVREKFLWASPRHLLQKTASYLLNRFALDHLQDELYKKVQDILLERGKPIIAQNVLFSIISGNKATVAKTSHARLAQRLAEIAEMRIALTPAHIVAVVRSALRTIDPQKFAAQIATINEENIVRLFPDYDIELLCSSYANVDTCDKSINGLVRGEREFHASDDTFARRFNKAIGNGAGCPLPDPIIPEK